MASRIANHEHRWRIIAHTVTRYGKEFKVMLGCGANFRCPAISVKQPRQNRKHDTEFWDVFPTLEHLCCNADLTQYETVEKAA